MGVVLEELWIYPLKSAGGVRVPSVELDRFGPALDRRWMLLDREGEFLSQRTHPEMARISVALDGPDIRVRAPGLPEHVVPPAEEGPDAPVELWGKPGTAVELPSIHGEWFSEALGQPVRVVFLPGDRERRSSSDHIPSRPISFADGYPLVAVSTESLAELNRRLARPVDMRRFRPNLVVSGCRPHGEDHWMRIRIGGVEFEGAKPCPRCTLTTVDPDTGRKGTEPLATLATYRRKDGAVWFGQNLAHLGNGVLREGSPVEVLEEGEPPAGPLHVEVETNPPFRE